jgi:hypothetical protein
VQRLDEPEAKFAGDFSEGTGDSKQVHARDPGDVLAGVGVSFAQTWIGVGAAPELALAGKLGALRAGRESLGEKAGRSVPQKKKKARASGPSGSYFYFIESREVIGQLSWILVRLE